MWVVFKKTYVGSQGLFIGGVNYDLPESVLKKIPQAFWQLSRAPWDAGKAIAKPPKDKQHRPGKAGANYATK